MFFFISVFFTGFDESSGDEKYFIYLTNFIFLAWTAYTVWAAFSVTLSFLTVFGCQRRKYKQENEGGPCNHELTIEDRPVGCCGFHGNKAFWHQRILWILFTISVHMSVYVVILYWGLLYDPSFTNINYFSFVNIVTHVVAGVVAIMDVFITAIPYRLLHVIYPFCYGAVWLIFSGIYYAAGGTNNQGRSYIYNVIDYMNSPVTASIYGLVVLFVGTPFIHLVIYCLFLLRELLLFLIGKYCLCQSRVLASDAENDDEVMELNKNN